jgi:hypothetical protein
MKSATWTFGIQQASLLFQVICVRYRHWLSGR